MRRGDEGARLVWRTGGDWERSSEAGAPSLLLVLCSFPSSGVHRKAWRRLVEERRRCGKD